MMIVRLKKLTKMEKARPSQENSRNLLQALSHLELSKAKNFQEK